MTTILTRMGDGLQRRDDAGGSARGPDRRLGGRGPKGKIPTLERDEYDYLYEMFASPTRIWGVERGCEAILTKDGSTNSLYSAQLSSGVGLPLSREQAFRTFERAFGFDTMEVGHIDYSVKPRSRS